MQDLHKIWGHRWLTPKALVKTSPIHGLGTFAIKPIRKGEVISVTGGIVVPHSDIARYRKMMGHIGSQINDDFFIVPASRKEIEKSGVFNHSCEPNRGFVDSVTTIAIKSIGAGEELTADYAFFESDFKPFRCGCNAANCRKIIKPTDWKIKALQDKYGQYFSPYLKRKISL
ncbi:MAG: SET domain-containing protein-lysine N-methyltransferase [Candidatus Aenigmarchaeota archaeon]|nr:SET domain-containing protein-lysine N-methyltransferase [Candidatus Aenigmarchaeota archaeon]